MTEIFQDVRKEVKDTAKIMWEMALTSKNPILAATFLNNLITEYAKIWTEEEVEFLRFYFEMQMEMMKK